MLQLANVLNTGISEFPAATQVEVGKVLQLANVLNTGIGDQQTDSPVDGASHAEVGKVLQLDNMFETGVRDAVAATQVEVGEVLQLANVLKTGISEVVAVSQVEGGKVLQPANVFEPGISEVPAATQVEVGKVLQPADELNEGIGCFAVYSQTAHAAETAKHNWPPSYVTPIRTSNGYAGMVCNPKRRWRIFALNCDSVVGKRVKVREAQFPNLFRIHMHQFV